MRFIKEQIIIQLCIEIILAIKVPCVIVSMHVLSHCHNGQLPFGVYLASQ